MANGRWAALLGGVLLVISASGVGAASTAKPHVGGTLTIGMKGDALTLDPMVTTDEYSKPVESLLYNSLVKLGPNQQIEPSLARSWTISDSGLVYTFHLLPGVRFHDGSTMTASDVVYSFHRIMSKQLASPWASFFQAVKSVTATGKDTVRVTLSQPDAPFLTVIASFLVVMNPSFVAAHKNITRVEDGTGPYILANWTPNKSITLVRNPHYFVPGKPYIKKIVFDVIPSTSARIAALQSGQVQFAEFLNPVHYKQLEAMASAGTIHASKFLSSNYHMFGFNTKWGPFRHQRVRLALSYALNRRAILESAALGEGQVTGILTRALSSWAIPVSSYPSYTTNIAKAKRLLAAAGYPHGFQFNIMAPSSFPVDLNSAQIISNQLKAIGVTAKVVPTEWGTYVNNWVKRSFQSFTGENGDWTDPDLAMYAALHTGGSTNAFQFSNPRVDHLLAEGRTTTNTARRRKIYDRLQTLVVEQAPMIYTFATYNLIGTSPALVGYVHVSGSAFRTLASAWLAK